MFGRRLYLPDINSRNAQFRRRSARDQRADAGHGGRHHQAAGGKQRDCYHARLMMQVHDELVLEAAEDRAADIAARTSAATWRPPRPARAAGRDVGIGRNWDEAH